MDNAGILESRLSDDVTTVGSMLGLRDRLGEGWLMGAEYMRGVGEGRKAVDLKAPLSLAVASSVMYFCPRTMAAVKATTIVRITQRTQDPDTICLLV